MCACLQKAMCAPMLLLAHLEFDMRLFTDGDVSADVAVGVVLVPEEEGVATD